MKTTSVPSGPLAFRYSMQPETAEALEKLCTTAPGTVSLQAARLGFEAGEPLLIILDAAIRYAKAYEKRFEQKAGEDYVLSPGLSKILSGVRELCNGDGAVAMDRGITTDSKDNGSLETLYWDACRLAGLDGGSIA